MRKLSGTGTKFSLRKICTGLRKKHGCADNPDFEFAGRKQAVFVLPVFYLEVEKRRFEILTFTQRNDILIIGEFYAINAILNN